jgi:hypothetical protein
MAVNIPGLSTLEVKVGYGVEATAGTKPASFTQLERCNAIGGISLSTEQIDVSALEDTISKYTSGRADSGGTWNLTFNLSDEVITQLEAMIAAATTGKAASKRTWFEVTSPYLAKGFFIVAEPPAKLPLPETGQNEAWTVEIELVINEYIGLDTKVAITTAGE